VVPLLFVLAALGIGAALISSPPHVPKTNPETMAPVVEVSELLPGDIEVFIEAFGTVVPSRSIRVMPEVGGRIIELHQQFEPGGLINRGELLFKIDPAGYEIAVAQSKADLQVARHETSRIKAGIEALRGRARQLDAEMSYTRWNAERVWKLAEQDSAGQMESRDVRSRLEVQIAARETVDAEIAEQEMAVESAQAGADVAARRLESAELALARTVVKAPFDAIVVSENVEQGQLISPQSSIAILAATDAFWAEAAVPVSGLRDIRFSIDDPQHASRVRVWLATGGDSIEREGFALRPLGNLDPLGRMARVLISIRDPLGLADEAGASRRVLLGSYVRVRIEAGVQEDVYVIPRKALRENDRIWVRDADGKLAIRSVSIVWRRQEDVLVRNGFEAGDELVTSHLASVVPGMPLRIRGVVLGDSSENADVDQQFDKTGDNRITP
jgi:multidrug efflux pump subunit AcrA (membrane-fusion protein)